MKIGGGVERLPKKVADYAGMFPSKWPAIRHEDGEIYDRLYKALSRLEGQTRGEMAQHHRTLHYLLGG